MNIKCKLTVSETVDKKYVHVAHKIIMGNAESVAINTDKEKFYDDSIDTMPLGFHGGFVGYIPKSWLTPIEED